MAKTLPRIVLRDRRRTWYLLTVYALGVRKPRGQVQDYHHESWIMAGIKKHSDDCKQNMVNGRFSTHLQIHCYSVMKAKDRANKTKKAQAAIKLQKANEARRLNESEETNLGLRNRMRGVSAPAGPTGPDVSDAVAVLGAQPTSSGKLDTSVLDYGIGKCIVLLFVYNNYII